MQERRIEQILGLSALLLLVGGCFLILRPFLSAILWAVILCYSTWPVLEWLKRLIGNRRTLAASLMTLAAACVIVMPFALVGPRLANDATMLSGEISKILEHGPPGPPAWIVDIPVIGSSMAAQWQAFAYDGAKFTAELRSYIDPWKTALVSAGVSLGQGVLELCLSLVIAFFLYRDGSGLALRVSTATRRFAGNRGHTLLGVAGATTRGVVYGILGTALAQGILAGIGFTVVGLDGALFLGLLTFFLSLVPMGPPLVWLPVSIWLLSQGDTGRGLFILLWGALVVSGIDNFLKPYFISRTGNLPFLLIFLGVFGGVVAFGFIGIFLGPVLLAIGFSLAKEWTNDPHAGRLS